MIIFRFKEKKKRKLIFLINLAPFIINFYVLFNYSFFFLMLLIIIGEETYIFTQIFVTIRQ